MSTVQIPNIVESVKERFDRKFPEAKMLRAHELKKVAHNLFNKSALGKATSLIYLIIALSSIFVYRRFFDINIFFSILLGIMTWFIVTYVLDKTLIKLSGVERILVKINDEEIETSGKKLEEAGISIDNLLN